MSHAFESFRIDHVPREKNREADALVNQALDETSGVASRVPAGKPAAKENTMRLFARYKDGLLQPEEPLDLPEGTEVEIVLQIRK
jgi:hypothetical protein